MKTEEKIEKKKLEKKLRKNYYLKIKTISNWNVELFQTKNLLCLAIKNMGIIFIWSLAQLRFNKNKTIITAIPGLWFRIKLAFSHI